MKPLLEFQDIPVDGAVRLPCQPGLPFLLSLKALIHEMDDDPKYFSPDRISITRKNTEDGKHQYTLTLLLPDKGRQGQSVDMDAFKKSFASWKERGRNAETEHFTQQRLGDLEFCKLPLRRGEIIGPKAEAVAKTTTPAVTIDFARTPPSITIQWKVNKP